MKLKLSPSCLLLELSIVPSYISLLYRGRLVKERFLAVSALALPTQLRSDTS